MAGEQRFHSKFHKKSHHTNPTVGYPDSGSDPIASPAEPFQGNFVVNGLLSSNAGISFLSANVPGNINVNSLFASNIVYANQLSGFGTEAVFSDFASTVGNGNNTLTMSYLSGIYLNTSTIYFNTSAYINNNRLTINTISAVNLSGVHYGDGSKLTGIVTSSSDPTKLPLSGGTLTGGLTGTTALFTNSISSVNLSGTHFGDGGNLFNIPSQINFIFDGNDIPVTLNSTGTVQIPYNIRITSWAILANTSSNAEVQVLTSNYANHPTYGIISGTTNTPKLVSASKSQSSTMTDWVTAIPADSYLKFIVIANDSAINLTVSLKCLRTS